MGTHSLGVDRMDGEQQRGHQAGGPVHQQAAEAQEEDAHGHVKNHIEQMVGGWTQLAQQVVQAKGEHSEWPVGFMTPLLRTKKPNIIYQTA